MFGPNPRGTIQGPAYHHRGPEYAQLLDDLQSEFKKLFGRGYDYLFLSGSGTMANEAVIASSRSRFQFPYAKDEFSGRLRRLADTYSTHNEHSHNYAIAHYETAIATRMEFPENANKDAFHFADCVSSLPYYNPPEEAKVWTTVSSKQFGGLPICSIIAVHKRYWSNFFHDADSHYSILNLARYRASQKKGQSPHTPSIPLLADLLERLQDLKLDEFRTWIDERRSTVLDHFGMAAFGEGPTVCLETGVIRKKIAQKFGLYTNALGDYQLFLYSSPEVDMTRFCQELSK